MRAIVTGGAGFIGSHLIERLVGQGHEPVCIEHPNARAHWIDGLPVEWLPCGIHQSADLVPAFRDADVVFHLAGLTEARRPHDFYRVNTEGTAHVLRAASARPNPPHVILLSSLAAIGPCRNGERLSPDTVPFPLSHYGRSKLLAESVVHAYSDRVPTTIVRLPSVYGPRERGVLKLFQLVRRGLAMTIGSWDREVSMIYVDDVVSGLLALAHPPQQSGRVYCLAYPDPVTWREFARVVGQVMERDPFLLSVPSTVARLIGATAEAMAFLQRKAAILNRERIREMSQDRWVCDPSRIINEVGFTPTVAFADGISRTAAWYREVEWL